jgi:Ca-activated chloride channel family protein
MRPQSRGETEVVESREASAEIMFVLDVSKSMLAEDAAPSRLERAKAEIRDLVRLLAGHRLGLIAFAGRSSVVCPLTPDHGFFRLVLDSVSTGTVTRGGTRIGDALRRAVEGFAPGGAAKAIVLVTDGEDHESYPLEAAKEAREHGVRVIAIGFGSEEGSEILVTDPKTGERGPLRDRAGKPVRSRLDGETLRKIALETEGVYIPAGVGVLDLESIVRTHIEPIVRGAGPAGMRMVRAERYRAPLAGALAALVVATALGAAPGARAKAGTMTANGAAGASTTQRAVRAREEVAA